MADDEIIKKENFGNCPKCGYEQISPAEYKSANKKIKPYIWEGDCIKCANCGFTQTADWWELYDYECLNADE